MAKSEVALDLYYKAAGFWFDDRNVKTLLQSGTYQLRENEKDVQRKLRAADEFDKPAIQKQLDELYVQVVKKREEIKGKTFYQEYDDCSPSDVKMEENFSSFTFNVSKGFIPIGQEFGPFVSPFPDVTADVRGNKYDDIGKIVASHTGEVLPRWTTIVISGDTESIKTLVRGMRDNPKRYSLKLWFTELQGGTNERVGIDLSSPLGGFAPAKRWTEFLVFAKIVKIQIVDKSNSNSVYN